jgi:hypothetical protein
VCFGRGVRLRPGGALPARFVAEGLGLLARGVADPEEDGEPEGEPGCVERREPVDGSGAGEGTAVGDGWAGPGPAAPPEPGAPCTGPPPPPSHGMIVAPGPPSRPAAITVRHVSNTTVATAPANCIRRILRPDTSVNTGLP